MKFRFQVTVLAIAAMLSSCSLYAAAQQEDNASQSQTQTEHQREGRHGDRGQWMLQHLTTQLSLSADQQSQVKTILDDQRTQFEGIRQDSSLSQEQRHQKMMDVHKTTSSKIRSILNPDQQTKFDKMQQEMRSRGGHHHGGESGGENNASNQ